MLAKTIHYNPRLNEPIAASRYGLSSSNLLLLVLLVLIVVALAVANFDADLPNGEPEPVTGWTQP